MEQKVETKEEGCCCCGVACVSVCLLPLQKENLTSRSHRTFYNLLRKVSETKTTTKFILYQVGLTILLNFLYSYY